MGMWDKGYFQPPPPVRRDILKWMRDTEKSGFKPPPVQEATNELMEIYNNYLGAETGVR